MWLAGAYAVAAVTAGFTVLAALWDWTPEFFVENTGGTFVRNLVLASALFMLLLTVKLLQTETGAPQSKFVRWYTLSLLLLSMSSFGLIFARKFIGKMSWSSQTVQYVSSIYMFMAAYTVFRKKGYSFQNLVRQESVARHPFILALLLVLFSVVLRLVFLQVLGTTVIFITFSPAVVLAALYGGFWPGILASAASVFLVDFFWLEPEGMHNHANQVSITIFLLSGAMISWICEKLQRANVKLRNAEIMQRKELERLVVERTGALTNEIQVRKNVEQSLIDALDEVGRGKAELSALLDVAPVAVCIARDTSCNTILGNKAADDILRLPRGGNNSLQQSDSLPYRVVNEALEEIPSSQLPVQRAARGERVEGYAFYLLFKDGSLRHCYGHAEPLRDENGVVTGAVCAFLDITHLKQIERELRESEARFRAAQDASLDAFVIYKPIRDDDGQIVDFVFVYANKMAAKYCQTTPDKMEGRLVSEVIPGSKLPGGLIERHKNVVLSGKAEEYILDYDADGIKGYFRNLVVPFGPYVATTFRDISRLKRAERALKESEERARLLEKTLTQGIVHQNREGEITGMNAAAETILGRTASEMLSHTSEDHDHQTVREDGSPFPGKDHPIMVALRTGKTVSNVVMGVFNPRMNMYRWISIDSVPLFHQGEGTPYEAYSIFSDITDTIEANKALAAAKIAAERANLGKSKFLATASHDLRQPVQSLALLLSAMESHVVKRPQAAKTLNMMKTAVDGLSSLLNAILDISRLDADLVVPVLSSVDVSKVLNHLAREYAPAAETKGLHLRAAPRPLRAWTDPGLLDRVLRNLIENALRYTTKGGVLIGVRQRGDRIRIDVVDTGIGIPKNKQARIFEEFYQINNPDRDGSRGMGLGLSIVARVVRLLDGEVEVASHPGRGSRFSLLLPADRGALAAEEEPPSEAKDLSGRILIIEDNALLREGFLLVMEAWGCKAFSAADGEGALALAERENWRFDAIVTDHHLGRGLTGIATAKEIERRAERKFPTIVITGDSSADHIADIQTSGYVVLHKPVRAEELRSSLARLLDVQE